MPPSAAAIRKASLLSSAAGDPSSSNNVRRTNSGRAVRTNTTRPANYYARPYARQGPEDLIDDTTPAGFFPALTFFTDAVTALPKEVMRHLTLMKEVEAKVHGPNERLGEAVDALLEQPVPRRSDNTSGPHGGMLSFTAANSAIGSANVSLVNGVAPYGAAAGQDSTAASVAGEDTAQDGEGDMERRRQYHELRMITHNLLANLDEKNVVLTEANRVLGLQMSRLDSVMPHVEEEIPEEARLGSMTHWAYSDNRLKVKPLPPAASERNRRDVALTNSLAAAASAIHETDILAARRDATKDTGKEKTGRGRQREQFDSEFEDRPKKTTAKVARGKAAAAAAAAAAASSATGLGISTNGEPVKRRKVDKVAGAPAMERQASTKSKVGKETPRSTPAAEPAKKVARSKAAPPAPPKRKNVSSAQATPVAAASPLQATFSAAQTDANAGRPQSARLTKTSTTNLRHEKVMDQEESRPTTASSKSNGEKEKTAGKKRAREEEEPTEAAEPAPDETVQETTMKHEDVESSVQRPVPSRSNSSKKTSSRQSNAGTPRAEDPGSDTAMARTRSTRSMRGNGETPGSETPNYPRANHKRAGHGGSMSGLMRQIAPFNRSPDHGRDEDDPDEDLDSNSEGEGRFRARSSMRRSNTGSRNVSRRTTSRKRSGNSSRDRERRREGEKRLDDMDTEMANATDDKNVVSSREPPGSPPPAPALTHSPSPSLSSQAPSPSQLTPAPQPQRSPPPPAATRSPEREAEAEAEPEVENEAASSLPTSSAASPLASPVPDSPPRSHATRGEARTEQVPSRAESEAPATDDEDPDPDDPSEPKYCYCLRGSYGDMVGCDNPKCEREWFHLGCTDLEIMPGEEESWFCTLCRPRGRLHGVGSRGGARGGGGGRGKRGRGRGRGG